MMAGSTPNKRHSGALLSVNMKEKVEIWKIWKNIEKYEINENKVAVYLQYTQFMSL